MPIVVNGRQLGVAQNGLFNDQNTSPIPGGRLWKEAAVTWNAMRAAFVAQGGNPGDFVPAGPNSSARNRAFQDYVWKLYLKGGNPAARPYTSNHGWGIAVDVKTPVAASWILRNGAKFGWSHDEGQRVGEWWHYRYIGLTAAQLKAVTRAATPMSWLTSNERRWCKEYDKLRREHRDPNRQAALREAMTAQRKRIWREAQQGGWDKNNRRKRYQSLLARTR
jgi:hypothetical protein